MALIAFVWWELRTPKPAVDLSVLKNASFTTGTLIGGILGVSLYSSMFLLPLYMQELLNYPAMKSGLVLMPRSLVMLVLMPVAGAAVQLPGAEDHDRQRLLIAGWRRS